MVQQADQYLAGPILKLQPHAVLAELGRSRIEFEHTEAVDGSVAAGHRHPQGNYDFVDSLEPNKETDVLRSSITYCKRRELQRHRDVRARLLHSFPV